MKIYLDDVIKHTCQIFAENVVGTNLDEYNRRNQFNQTMIIQQIYEGKLAEWAVYKCFSQHLNISNPDMEIYNKEKKSFEADLKSGNFNFHVKSQNAESVRRYGMSWICQKYDPLIKNPKDTDIIVFCVLNKDESVEIKSIKSAKNIKWDSPKLDKLKSTKVAFYL